MITKTLLRFLWGAGGTEDNINNFGFALAPLLILVHPSSYTLGFFSRLSAVTKNPFLDLFYTAAGLFTTMAVMAVTILPATALLIATLAISIAVTVLVSPVTYVIDLFRSCGNKNAVDDKPFSHRAQKPAKNGSSTRDVFTVAKPGVTVGVTPSQQEIKDKKVAEVMKQEASQSIVPCMDEFDGSTNKACLK
jgi:hypothetical protein